MPFGIDRRIFEAFRLQEDLMAVALAEFDDLVLDRGAIARPSTGDLAGIHRGTVNIRPDDVMGRRRGAGDATLDLGVRNSLGKDGKGLRRVLAGLHLQGFPVDGPAIKAGRGAGLEPPEGKSGRFQGPGKTHSGCLPDPAGRNLLLTDMDEASQEGPRGQDHGAGRDLPAVSQFDPTDAGVLQNEVVGLGLDHFQAGNSPQLRLHGLGIELAVGLSPRPADRGAFAAVQDPKLDAPGIGHPAHQAVERIDFAHQMALAQAPNSGIAGHGTDGIEAMGDERRPRAHTGAGRGGLTAGVAATDHDDVEGCAHPGPQIAAL